MRNNRTLLAAAGFVILALIYYFTQTGSVDTKAIDSELFRIKRDLIGSVQLNNSSGTLVLEKGPDAWTLDNYPADTLKISSLLTQFSDLTVDRLITKNADKYTQYEVGEHGNSILILRADGFPLLELILGKQGANYGETFVRDPTDDQVFAVKANLSQYKKMAPKDFWDRTFTHLELSEINTIEFSGEINYGIKREGPSWTFNGELVDPDKVINLIRPLGNMKANGFAAGLSDEMLPYQSINIGLTEGTSLGLSFFKKDEKGTTLLVSVSGNPKIFEYSAGGLNRFKKSVTDLLPEPPPN